MGLATWSLGNGVKQAGSNWVGSFNSVAEANAWAASYGSSLMVGSTATIAGVPSVYQGAGVGWGALNSYGPPHYASYNSLPVIANDGDVATIPQLVGNERVKMHYVAADSAWEVEPGQCLINAHMIFEVAPVPSTAAILYAFPWSAGIIRPNQIWRLDSFATGTFGGGVGSGYRERFGGSATTNSAKTTLVPATPRARSNKTVGLRSNGKIDTMEFNGVVGAGVNESMAYSDAHLEIMFEPGQVGDSFVLEHFSLRRIG